MLRGGLLPGFSPITHEHPPDTKVVFNAHAVDALSSFLTHPTGEPVQPHLLAQAQSKAEFIYMLASQPHFPIAAENPLDQADETHT